MRGDLENKDRKHFLEVQRIINCGYCKYNRGENAKRKPKPDLHKNKDRKTIRKENYETDGA
jgi:hypothetical protein